MTDEPSNRLHITERQRDAICDAYIAQFEET